MFYKDPPSSPLSYVCITATVVILVSSADLGAFIGVQREEWGERTLLGMSVLQLSVSPEAGEPLTAGDRLCEQGKLLV